MKNISQVLAVVTALLLFGALIATGIAAFDYLRTLYLSLDPQLARITATSLIALLITAWILSRITRQSAAKRMRQQLGDEITATYQYFVDYWTSVFADKHYPDDNPEEPSILDRLLALYGSAKVIKAHMRLRTMMQKRETPDADVYAEFSKALLAIRKDLGADSQGLSAKDLQLLVLPEQNPEARNAEVPQQQTNS